MTELDGKEEETTPAVDLEDQPPETDVPEEGTEDKRRDWIDPLPDKLRAVFSQDKGEPEVVDDESSEGEIAEPEKPKFPYQVYGNEREVEIPDGLSIEPGSDGEKMFRDTLAAAGAFHEKTPEEERQAFANAIEENTAELKRQREAQEKTEASKEFVPLDYLSDAQKDFYEREKKAYEDQGMDSTIADLNAERVALKNIAQFEESEKQAEDDKKAAEKQAEDDEKKVQAERQANFMGNLNLLHQIDPDAFPDPSIDAMKTAEAAGAEFLPWVAKRIKALGGNPAKAQIDYKLMYDEFKILTGKTAEKKPQPPGNRAPAEPKPHNSGIRNFREIEDTVEGAGGKPIGKPEEIDERTLFAMDTRELKKTLKANPKAQEIYDKKHESLFRQKRG